MTDAPVTATRGLATIAIDREDDIALARQRARSIAAALGCDAQDQVRFATAVSELARSAFRHARAGDVQFSVMREGAASFVVARVADRGGPAGSAVDGRGAGALASARRLVERFAIEESPTGSIVTIGKELPAGAPAISDEVIDRIAAETIGNTSMLPVAELQRVTDELAATMDLLRGREAEEVRLAQELADTNRGVVALYAELDDRAQQLARMSDSKTRFLSDVSHELRTPLSSIVNLSRLLLSYVDGPLLPEQERQVTMIRKSAEWLTDMVNDLLDVAKIESGTVVLRPDTFDVRSLFAALRGTLRPLVTNEAVRFVLEDPAEPITLFTDEQRVAQVLRNFVSNAIKFTAEGEVRVTARVIESRAVQFTVADTGIGIAPEDQARVFQEFVQVDGPIQRRVRGTGLGLPLTVKLARILRGEVTLESAPGTGSRFSLRIPRDVRDAMSGDIGHDVAHDIARDGAGRP